MPVHQSLWRLAQTAQKLQPARLDSERQLEDFIVENPEMLDPNWLLIGRQVQTDFKGIIDLLALQPDGTPVVIELKREKTSREVLAQTLDYASWLEDLEPIQLQKIYESFIPEGNLASDFEAKFGSPLGEEALANDHLMVIVAAELDTSTERIVRFLSKRGVNINVLFFQVFQGNDELLLSRSWFVDPSTTQVSVSAGDQKGQWNGEYYVSYGTDETRHWEDGRTYGFITASGGAWYTRTLDMLDPGDRVWVNIPGTGYVGVGTVTGKALPFEDFVVTEGNRALPVGNAATTGNYEVADEETRAWFVPVEWITTVSQAEAIKEVGFFGNQNTVAKPKSEKWEHTVSVLKRKFSVKS
jgi:hypothetical protein